MVISNEGMKQLETFEGFRSAAYKCVAGVYTIGYGTTVYSSGKKVAAGDTITHAAAEKELNSFLKRNVYPKLKAYTWLNQKQFDALCSFLYNIGSFGNSMKAALEKKNIISVRNAMLQYTKAGGKVIEGLKNRRIQECYAFAPSLRVREYQNAFNADSVNKKLSVDGIAGKQTLASLPTLKVGIKNHKHLVGMLQSWLGIENDGIYGSVTKAAVMEYQTLNGLKADGIAGRNTLKNLLGI